MLEYYPMEYAYITFKNGVIRIFYDYGYHVEETFNKVFFNKVSIYCENPYYYNSGNWFVENYRDNPKDWKEVVGSVKRY